jgi:chemotaxis protein methyltransferase CheR
VAQLVDEVTINETYFYRAARELEAVPWGRLHAAALARGNPVLRVWVSACATGEEAYTLAMLATDAFGGVPPVSILATDISEAVLTRARAAVYSDRSVANLPQDLYERYLLPDRGGHVVRDRLRSLVRFEQHNMITDAVPAPGAGAFDVVACRNVLIYFDARTAERVVTNLRSALAPGGHLVLGAADVLSGAAVRHGQPAERSRGRLRPAPRKPAPKIAVQRAAPAPIHSDEPIGPALAAADAGDLETAITLTSALLEREPLNSDGHFVRGLAEFGLGKSEAALGSFRRALFLDPSFGLAAFQLGRVSDALGDDRAARRAYSQALTTLTVGDDPHPGITRSIDVADVADACRTRLLSPPTSS